MRALMEGMDAAQADMACMLGRLPKVLTLAFG